MPREDATDIAALLAPIPGPPPTGTDVRYAGDHDLIREARRADDPALPQGVWRHEPKRADWAAVETLATETLRQRSKDLQVAAWLAEALVQRRGFLGLVPGIRPAARAVRAVLGRAVPGARARRSDCACRTARLAQRTAAERAQRGCRSRRGRRSGPIPSPTTSALNGSTQSGTASRRRPRRPRPAAPSPWPRSRRELAATPDERAARDPGGDRGWQRRGSWHSSASSTGISAGKLRVWARCASALQDIGGLLATSLRGRPNRIVEAARRLVGGDLAGAPAASAVEHPRDHSRGAAAAHRQPRGGLSTARRGRRRSSPGTSRTARWASCSSVRSNGARCRSTS